MGKSEYYEYSDGDSDHSQNLMGSKLEQDPSFDILYNPANKQNRQTKGHENYTSLVEVIKSSYV